MHMLSTKLEIQPPDISAYKQGNTGIDYVHRFKSDIAGPNITITAIVHGNEICGAIALDKLLKLNLRPQRGSLTLCFCNIAAYHSFDKNHPYASRYIDEDFNRLWTAGVLDERRESQELIRAKELRPIIEQTDILLDLHSMSDECLPLALAGTQKRGTDLAKNIGIPEPIVIDPGHSAGARLRDFEPFIASGSKKNALLIECGQHWQQSSVDVAFLASIRFLTITGCIAEEDLPTQNLSISLSKKSQLLNVTHAITVKTEEFHFVRKFQGLDVIATQGTILGFDGGDPILTPYDNCVLIMPTPGAVKGQTAIRLAKQIII